MKVLRDNIWVILFSFFFLQFANILINSFTILSQCMLTCTSAGSISASLLQGLRFDPEIDLLSADFLCMLFLYPCNTLSSLVSSHLPKTCQSVSCNELVSKPSCFIFQFSTHYVQIYRYPLKGLRQAVTILNGINSIRILLCLIFSLFLLT